MTLGDAIHVKCTVIDNEKGELPYQSNGIILYADAECADWLESVPVNATIVAKVKLAMCIIDEVKEHTSGLLLTKTEFKGLILCKGISYR